MPSRQRSFWNLTLIYLAVFAPLAIAAAIVAVLFFQVRVTTAISGLILLSIPALISVMATAWLFGKRIADSVNSARDVLSQVSDGDFAGRVPGDQRFLIEPLSQSIDRMQEYLRSRFAELQASRDQLRTVLDSMVEGVIAVDSGQRVLLINDAACRLFRIQDGTAVGRPLWERVRSPQLQQWVTDALRSRDPVGGEVELIAPLSRTLSVRVTGLPANASGGAIVVASDISQLRRLEQVRQEFVANASHELKTPLASIKACVETLLDGALEDSEVSTRFLQTINEQSERLDRLIRDLLSLTRIESEGMKTDLHAVPLAEIVRVCHERHRQNAERKRMQLITVPPPQPVQVLGDEEALEQILDNLVDNAIKYTNEEGTVTIRWGYQDEGCVLEVEDTGIGIPQSHVPRIFERFYRVDKARSRELGGTGLGLAIVKHLVQALGGVINVNSRLGKGTAFAVQLRLPERVMDSSPSAE